MQLDDLKIKEILVRENYLAESDAKAAEKIAAEHRSSLTAYLLSSNLISQELLGQAIAESLHTPYADLRAHPPTKEMIGLISEVMARRLRVVVYKQTKTEIFVATDNPEQEGLVDQLKKELEAAKIVIAYALPVHIDTTFAGYQKGLETRFSEIIKSNKKIAPELVNQIFEDALTLRVSDIHIEPQETRALVRFRIDGVLHDAGIIPLEYIETIINRIKIQAKLRIDEHFNSQDGAIRFTSVNGGPPTDLRVSIVPTLDGEKVAIRILSNYIRELTLSDIGISETLSARLQESIKKPFGMILVTGPTGSGKTTTLYSLIKELNTRSVNITTIEDPVEYKIDGVNQIQANAQTNLTFAKGLRAIARQDPNIIFVGEIRDTETADIAVNAALTGHLLLSSFHANNAAAAIPRFIDMGIEPFLVSSTLELVIAQRLVRRICNSCKVSEPVSKARLAKLGIVANNLIGSGEHTFYRGKGCPKCSGTGYNGRIGIFEFITVTPELQDLIARRPSTKEISELVSKQKFVSMFADGIEKVKNGLTSLEELLRVITAQ